MAGGSCPDLVPASAAPAELQWPACNGHNKSMLLSSTCHSLIMLLISHMSRVKTLQQAQCASTPCLPKSLSRLQTFRLAHLQTKSHALLMPGSARDPGSMLTASLHPGSTAEVPAYYNCLCMVTGGETVDARRQPLHASYHSSQHPWRCFSLQPHCTVPRADAAGPLPPTVPPGPRCAIQGVIHCEASLTYRAKDTPL